jgi:hypothetical protein
VKRCRIFTDPYGVRGALVSIGGEVCLVAPSFHDGTGPDPAQKSGNLAVARVECHDVVVLAQLAHRGELEL